MTKESDDDHKAMKAGKRPGEGKGLRAGWSRLRSGSGIGATFARGAFRSFAAKVLGLGMGFVLQVTLARLLGVELFGVYAFALSWVTLLIFVCLSGLDKTILRFLGIYLKRKELGLARGLLLGASAWVGFAAVLLTVSTWIILYVRADELDPRFVKTMAVAALLYPVLALSRLRLVSLNALKRVFRSEFGDSFLRPLLMVATLLSLTWLTSSRLQPHEAMTVHVAAAVVAFAVGARWLWRALPADARRHPPAYAWSDWRAMAMPMMVIGGMQVAMKQTDVIMLGTLAGTTQSGIYSVMDRLADFAHFGLLATSAMAAPMIAQLHAAGRRQELQRVVTLAVRGSLIFMMATTAVLLIFGRWITGLYGPGFEVGLPALYILLVGQAINAATGPVGLLVSMTGHQVIMAKVQGAVVVLNVLLNLLLIPRYGLVGAAVATSTSVVLRNVWFAIFVWRELKIKLIPF